MPGHLDRDGELDGHPTDSQLECYTLLQPSKPMEETPLDKTGGLGIWLADQEYLRFRSC